MNTSKIAFLTALAMAALVSTGAWAQDKKNVTQSEMNYQAAGSPLGNEVMHQSTNPKAPPIDRKSVV